MIFKHIEILVTKYLDYQLDNKEIKELNEWLEQGNNKEIFQEYIALNFTIQEKYAQDSDYKAASWKVIKKKIRSIRYKNYLKYVAAASIVLALAKVTIDNEKDHSVITVSEPVIIDNNIEIGSHKAILTLEDGSDVSLEKGKTYLTKNVSSDGEEIIYKEDDYIETLDKKLVYNSLTIPRGGQFYIELSDHTKVWLNSDTKIKYPKEFIEGQDRVVELEYGEAYFEVSSIMLHGGATFIVHTNDQKLEVLGTEFNVKAYENENAIYTTLVKGRVSVSNTFNSIDLIPNQQSVITVGDKDIAVRTVNVDNEISWKNGIFNFESRALKDIMRVLERWYDVNVVFENKTLEDIKFNGVLKKDQNIEEILISIKNTHFINDYKINDSAEIKEIVLK